MINREKIYSNLYDYLVDTIFPVECIYCEKDGVWICNNCYSQLKFKFHTKCLRCRKYSVLSGLCSRCQKESYLDGLYIAGDYHQEKIKKAIKLLKYRCLRDLGSYLGNFLSSFVKYLDEDILDQKAQTVVIPIPLHKKRQAWRGFNQVELIAFQLAQNLELPLNKGLLRLKHKKPQTKIKKSLRKNNIVGCFAWQGGNEIKNKNIILIDDVATTGSTLNEAAQVLKKQEVRAVTGLAVAGE